MKFLYIDIWHGGMRSPEEVDEMLAWADAHGVTDLFVMAGRIDLTTIQNPLPEGFDPIEDISKKKKKKHMHGWINASLVGRKAYKEETKKVFESVGLPYYPEKWLWTEPTAIPLIYLDLTIRDVQDFVVEKCKGLAEQYQFESLHIEKLRLPIEFARRLKIETSAKQSIITQLLQRIKLETGLSISVLADPVAGSELKDYADYKTWLQNGLIEKAVIFMDTSERVGGSVTNVGRYLFATKDNPNIIPFCNNLKNVAIFEDRDIALYSYALMKNHGN